jgi:hypothetical protein
MDASEVIVGGTALIFGLMIGIAIAATANPNFESDIGLSQEAGDLICQKITNNTNAYAIDWTYKQDEPKDSLICEIKNQMGNGLIQIKD